MKYVILVAAALIIASGCASPRTVIERQTRAVGERDEQAVAAEFPTLPRDSLRWAQVFWYVTRRFETSPLAIVFAWGGLYQPCP